MIPVIRSGQSAAQIELTFMKDTTHSYRSNSSALETEKPDPYVSNHGRC